jgi:putative ABC transport system permease protein
MDAELAEELRDHLDRAAEANRRSGMSEEEARRAATLAFGGVTRFTEEAREARGWRWLADGSYDVRHGVRLMRRHPGFALAMIFITALGIGSTSAIFSAVNGVLLRPLPFPDAGQVARLGLVAQDGRFVSDGSTSFELLSRESPVLDGVGAFTVGTAVVSGDGEPAGLRLEYVTPSLLRLLRVRPLLGRLLVDEDVTLRAPVVLLSHAIWTRRFAGDSGVIGRTMALDRVSHTIVGVMPAEFTGPFLNARDVWLPGRMSDAGMSIAGRMRGATLVVRLRDGVSRERAETWVNGIMPRRVAAPEGGDSLTARVTLTPVLQQVVGDVERPLLMLLAATACVLILVAANIATLVLARATTRDQEVALRAALGASHSRQLRQTLTETVLLTTLGGALGIALAWLGLEMVKGQAAGILPRATEITVDWRVVASAALLTLVTGSIAGLIPSLAPSSARFARSFRGTPGNSAAGWGRGGLRNSLVVVEVAASVVLLIGAALLAKEFIRVAPTAPGYAVDRRAVVQVSLRDRQGESARTEDDYRRFMHDVQRRMEGTGGVQRVAVTPFAPLVGSTLMVPITFESDTTERPGSNGHFRTVSHNFFDVMEIPLVAGRAFTGQDRGGGARVAIVNETAAARWWPGQSPLGRRLRFTLGVEPATAQIVGVVRDTRFSGRYTAGRPEIFLPFDQQPVEFMTFIAHTSDEPDRVLEDLKRAVWAVEPELPIRYAGTLEEIAGESVREQRVYMSLLTAFAAVALVLAASGIFSVMAYAVSQRTREIGIRIALGAPRSNVGKLVLRQGIVVAGIGMLIGVGAARLLSRYLETLLVEVAPTDAHVIWSVVGGFTLTVLLACAVPLWRAVTVDPVRSLKAE